MALQGPRVERPVSEHDIHAYTDGALASERAARVRRYLAACPGEWHRILFYRRLNAELRHSFGEAGAGAGAATAVRWFASARRHRVEHGGTKRRRTTALALACMLAGAALAWSAVSEPSVQVLDDAAVMAFMEAGNGAPATSSARSASPTQSTPESLAAPLANELVPPTQASAPAPFDFAPAGLRLVASGTVELGLFVRVRRWVYENSEGKPVVLLASRAWFARADRQWSARRAGNLRLLGWAGHGERWVLAGDARTRGLMRAADLATQDPTARADEAGNAEQQR
ncbi:anti-sigma factor family protein [Paraburkholderia sacchari]|uniref:anti-sigma factor family protein n=1 Tax=Paraburkholderia sacchari TaxID=159450 RepID=UPI001BD01142|nr:transcriptional regulator [Paraburkholderia sacchari]